VKEMKERGEIEKRRSGGPKGWRENFLIACTPKRVGSSGVLSGGVLAEGIVGAAKKRKNKDLLPRQGQAE